MNWPWDVFSRTCVCSKWKIVMTGGEEACPRVLSRVHDGGAGDMQVLRSDGRTLMQQPFAVHHQNNSSQFEQRQCLFQHFAGFTPPLTHTQTRTHTLSHYAPAPQKSSAHLHQFLQSCPHFPVDDDVAPLLSSFLIYI